MWTWIVFTKYSEETSSNRRKRRKDTRDILIKKARLKQRSILVLREQRASSLDFSYRHNMSRAASALCLLIFTGNADMSRILLERTGILLAYKYICISQSYIWFLFGNPVLRVYEQHKLIESHDAMDRSCFSEALCTRDNPSRRREDDAKLSAVHKNYPQIAESRWLLMASVFNIALLSHIGILTCLSVPFIF